MVDEKDGKSRDGPFWRVRDYGRHFLTCGDEVEQRTGACGLVVDGLTTLQYLSVPNCSVAYMWLQCGHHTAVK